MNNTSIAKEYDLNRGTVKKWCNRWAKEEKKIMQIEIDKPHKLKYCIETVLSDEWEITVTGLSPVRIDSLMGCERGSITFRPTT